MNLFPIILGIIAGSTVALGSILISKLKPNKIVMGYLGAFTGGILSYLALDTGSTAEEIVTNFLTSKDRFDFIIGVIFTSLGLLGTWVILSYMGKRMMFPVFQL